MIKLTLGELSDAIRKNGYTQEIGSLFVYKSNKMIGGCAIGQAYVNMKEIDKLKASLMMDAYYGRKGASNEFRDIVSNIVNMNDSQKLSLEDISNLLDEKYDRDMVLGEKE